MTPPTPASLMEEAERPMTPGEKEIAEGLDKFFVEEDAKDKGIEIG